MLTSEQKNELISRLREQPLGKILRDMGIPLTPATRGEIIDEIGEEEWNVILKERRDAKTLPPLGRQAMNAAQAVGRNVAGLARTGKLLASEEKVKARTSICIACSDFRSDLGKCVKCGCSVSKKVLLLHEKCPVDKW